MKNSTTKLKYNLWFRETSVIYEMEMNAHAINKRRPRDTVGEEEEEKGESQFMRPKVTRWQGGLLMLKEANTLEQQSHSMGRLGLKQGRLGSVGKELAEQMCGPEFGSQALTSLKARGSGHALVISALGRWG